MNLHDIAPKRLFAWAWYYITGGNGQLIGGQHMHHLFEIQRGDPPPMDEQVPAWRQHARYYWNPWRNNPPWDVEIRELVLCKLRRVRTQARFMRANEVWGEELRFQCPECMQIAGERGLYTNYRRNLMRNDPWLTIPQEERITTPDPVTGL